MKVGIDAVMLGAWAPLPDPCGRILDIGTGTGILALLAAERCPHAEVIGVEIDPAAAEQAAENFQASPYSARLRVAEAPIQDFMWDEKGTFDLIVSNPPFFSGGVLSAQLERQTARHTVRLSHADLLRAVQKLLSPTGLFCVILPKLEGLRFVEIAASMKFKKQHCLQLRPREGKSINRLLLAFGRADIPCEDETIIQYGEGQAWTEAFQALVGGYYL